MPYNIMQLFNQDRDGTAEGEAVVKNAVRRRKSRTSLTSRSSLPNCSCPSPPHTHARAERPRSQSIQHFFRHSRESERLPRSSPETAALTALSPPCGPKAGAATPKKQEEQRNGQNNDKARRRFRDTVINVLRLRSHSSFHKQQERIFMPSAPTSHMDAGPRYRQLHDSPRTNHVGPGGVALRQMNGTVTDHGSSRDENTHPASVECLVRRCAECFDAEGNCSNEDFPRILLLTHLWFMTSEQLIVLFTQLYEDENTSSDLKKSIFHAIGFWLHEFPHMFDLDAKLVRSLQQLQERSASDPDVDTSIIDLANKGSYKWMSAAHMSIRPNQVNRKRRKVSLVFTHLEPEELAIHISYLEYKSFRRLTLSDFHNYAVHGVIKDNLKLERAVFLFNNITHWVQCMVLDHIKPQERAGAFVKFVEIAKKLHSMRNFNTLMAIVGALTHTAIARMKKTMALVPKDSIKALDELVELLDSKANYCCYRRAYLQITNEFKIPVIGVLLKDLIALHAAYPDRVGDEQINVRKMMMIGGIFQELIGLQRYPFPYEVNRDLVNTLRVSLYLNYSEEEIYQLSVVREPRDVKHSTSSATPSPSRFVNMGFAEFARYTCQLDRETIKEHVTAMVGSVFKAYDMNGDGFISEAEFGSFIQNFPGIDSFATVDKDQDGRISFSEMLDYFLKISSTRRNEFTQNFKHDFVETTYFHPTFCEECEKLLWGLVKQGWKCKDCGINCHKHCKDRIVQECRPKPARNGSSTSSQSSQPKKGEKSGSREKSSVSSESDLSANGDIVNASIPALIEDEAFESSMDLKSSGKQSLMKRSTSLAAADVNSQGKLGEPRRSKMSSKTPPPIRKSSSPILTGKNVSLHRKMQNLNILKKRSSVKRVVVAHDMGTQTPGSIPGPDSPSHVSSFLYGKAPTVVKSSLRLGSTGDEEDDAERPPYASSQLPDKHTHDVSKVTSVECQTHSPPMGSSSTNGLSFDRSPAERRDSGLSGCSCSTSASATTSNPVTPVHADRAGSGTRFAYPVATTSGTSVSDSSAEKAKSNKANNISLAQENARLLTENERLREELNEARHLIGKLQVKLRVTEKPNTTT